MSRASAVAFAPPEAVAAGVLIASVSGAALLLMFRCPVTVGALVAKVKTSGAAFPLALALAVGAEVFSVITSGAAIAFPLTDVSVTTLGTGTLMIMPSGAA
jgi:hypothetical protein